MAEENKIIVLDLGSSHITAIAAEVTAEGKVGILAVEETRKKTDLIHGGIVEQKSALAFEITSLMTKIQNRLRVQNISKINLSINGKTMKTYEASTPHTFRSRTEITPAIVKELKDECREKFEQGDVAVYAIEPMHYELDSKIYEMPIGQKVFDIIAYFQVTVGNKKIRENIDGAIDRAGIIIDDYVPLSIEALAEATLTPEECEQGCALINLGATTTTLGIYQSGMLKYLLVVPLGSHHVTRDIQELGVSEHNAEQLKYKSEAMEELVTAPVKIRVPNANANEPDVLITTSFLATIVESRLDEILQPVFAAIGNYAAELEAGIVIGGGGAKQNGIIEYIENRTFLHARYADHSDKLADNTDDIFYEPEYAQIIGNVLLVNQYRKENPEQNIVKEPKIKKPNRFIEGVKSGIFDFFSNDNKM